MTIVDACESKTNTTPDFPMGWFSVARSHELLVGQVGCRSEAQDVVAIVVGHATRVKSRGQLIGVRALQRQEATKIAQCCCPVPSQHGWIEV